MVYVLLGTGFEEVEAITPVDLLRRAGIAVTTVGINGKTVCGGHNICIETDITIGQIDLTQLDMIVLPGGLGGVHSIRNSEEAMNAIRFAWENNKLVAAICAGPTVLADLGITNNKNTTCYPGCESAMGNSIVHVDAPVVRDGNVITAASAGCAVPFGLMLIEALQNKNAAEHIQQQIVIR